MQRPELTLAAAHGAGLPAGSLAAAGGRGVLLAAGSAAVCSVALPSGRVDTLALPASAKALGCLAYSAAAGALAVGEQGFKPAVFVQFGLAPGTPALSLRGHNFGIQALAWSPSGDVVASTGVEKDRQLIVWHPVSGAQLARTRLDEDYQALHFLDDRTLCAVNAEALTVWSLEKTVSIGRNQQFKLSRKRFALSLPPACGHANGGSKAPARVIGLAIAAPAGAGAAGRRLWAALDSGWVLQLRSGSGKPERVLDTKVGRLLGFAATPELLACASAGGELTVFDTTSLEVLARLACPNVPSDLALSPAAVGCVLEGTRLTALYSSGALCSWDCSKAAEPVLELTAAFHSSPIVDALVLQRGALCLVASCSVDGKVQLLQLEDGRLDRPATADLRQQAGLRAVRLSSLAASPDGSLLAAGDTTGSVHLFAVFESAPDYFRSVAVHSAEVTAAAFAPPFSAGPRSCQLLAVGAKSGALAVLDSMHGYAVVAQLQPAGGAPVVSLQWVQQGGQLRLLAAARDGRLAAHTLEASAQGQLAFTLEEGFRPSAPKGALVGMQAAVWGQVAAAGSKEGGVHIFDAITGEDLVQLAAERSAGDVSSFALDEGIAICMAVTSKNMLQVYDRQSGKVLASCKAHLGGTAISRVLLTPDAGHVVTVGEDASVRAWALPEQIRLACLSEQERLRQTVLLLSEAKSGGSLGAGPAAGGSELSELHPQNLEDRFMAANMTEASTGNCCHAASTEDGQAGGGSGVAASAEEGGQQSCPAGELKPVAPVPPSRHHGIADGLADQLTQLQAQFQTLKASPGRRRTAERETQAPAAATKCCANPAAAKSASSLAAAAKSASSLAAAASASLAEYLRTPRGSLISPVPSAPSQAAAAAPGASHGPSLLRGASSSRRQPWLSPREGSGIWVPIGGGEDEIAAAEAERCRALLRCSEGTEPEQPTGAEASTVPATAGAPAAAASPDSRQGVLAARPESVGSVSVKPKRGCWAKSPASGAARRPLSSLALPTAGGAGASAASAGRPATALGIEAASPEEFTCWSDPSSPGAATLGSRLGGPAGSSGSVDSAGSGASKRLSFSFGMPAPTPPKEQPTGGSQQTAGTPSFVRTRPKQPAAAAAANPCGPASELAQPSLALAAGASDASTPSLHFRTARSQAPPPSGPSISKPGGGLRGRPLVPPLALPRAQAAAPPHAVPAAQQGGTSESESEDEMSLREQHSGRSGGSPSPLSAAQQHSRPSTAASEDCSGTAGSYATTSSPESTSERADSVVSVDQAASDVFDSPCPMLPASHGLALLAEAEEEGGGIILSPPTVHENQLFDGQLRAGSGQQGINLTSAFSQSAELPAGLPPSPAATHGSAAPSRQASLQPSPASASQLSLPPSARSVGRAGGASDTSAFDHPPAYDPLAEEGVAGKVAAAAGSKRPRSRPPTAMQDTAVTNGLFGLSLLQSQASTPFSTLESGWHSALALAKNPAFATTPPASTPGVNLRRMSEALPGGLSSGGHLPGATAGGGPTPAVALLSSLPGSTAEAGSGGFMEPGPAGTGDKPPAAPAGPTPAAVLALFQQAAEGLRALQAQGGAGPELQAQLAALGISVCGFVAEPAAAEQQPGASADSQPSVGYASSWGDAGEGPSAPPATPGSGPSAHSGQSMAALKAEILRELRRDIAAGALQV